MKFCNMIAEATPVGHRIVNSRGGGGSSGGRPFQTSGTDFRLLRVHRVILMIELLKVKILYEELISSRSSDGIV